MRKSNSQLCKETVIHVEAETRPERFNLYQTGHGVYERKTDKRSYRKRQAKKLVEDYENGRD